MTEQEFSRMLELVDKGKKGIATAADIAALQAYQKRLQASFKEAGVKVAPARKSKRADDKRYKNIVSEANASLANCKTDLKELFDETVTNDKPNGQYYLSFDLGDNSNYKILFVDKSREANAKSKKKE